MVMNEWFLIFVPEDQLKERSKVRRLEAMANTSRVMKLFPALLLVTMSLLLQSATPQLLAILGGYNSYGGSSYPSTSFCNQYSGGVYWYGQSQSQSQIDLYVRLLLSSAAYSGAYSSSTQYGGCYLSYPRVDNRGCVAGLQAAELWVC